MKNYKKNLLGAASVMFGSLLFSSCNNLDEPSVVKQDKDKEIISLKVENLLKKAYSKSSNQDEIAGFVNNYQSMSSEELESFNAAQSAKLMKDYEGNSVALEELEKVSKMRTEINKLSITKFNKPYNQLLPEQINLLMDEFEGIEKASKNSRVAATASCNAWFFDRSYSRGTVPKLAADYNARVNAYQFGTQPNLSNPDCDCRIGFQTTAYSRVVPASGLAGTLLSFFGNNLGGRVANGATYLIVGQKRANIIFAGFGCTGAFYDLRMGNP